MFDENTWIDFLVRFVTESDAIENILDDAALVRLQFLQKQTDGHVGAMRLLGQCAQDIRNCYLTDDLICLVQGFIVSEQHTKPGGLKIHPHHIGKYRDGRLFLGKREFATPSHIASSMDAWITSVRWWQENCRFRSAIENVHGIASFHYQFEQIHPFADGNGRTGRTLAYFMFLHTTLAPFVFENHDKHTDYYPCFASSTPNLMRAYFEARWQRSFNQQSPRQR